MGFGSCHGWLVNKKSWVQIQPKRLLIKLAIAAPPTPPPPPPNITTTASTTTTTTTTEATTKTILKQ